MNRKKINASMEKYRSGKIKKRILRDNEGE